MTSRPHAGPERVQVVVASQFDPAAVETLRSVDGADVFFDPELFGPQRFAGDRRGKGGWRRTDAQQAQFERLLAGAEAVIGIPDRSVGGLAGLVRMAPDLRWVQGLPAGTGEVVRNARLSADELRRVVFTTGAGVHSSPLAEWAMLGLLAFAKDLPALIDARAAKRWAPAPVRTLRGSSLLIIGLGEIGREAARLAAGFGMRVTGVRRTPCEAPEGVTQMGTLEELPSLVRGADAVVLALPSTTETEGLFSRELIDGLPPHAVVVNVGRGSTIDEAALVDALREHRLLGAALDVTAVEPLPSDSPLWTLPRVLLSPHSAALVAGQEQQLLELAADNLRRYIAGEPLRNVVDTVHFY